MSLIPSDSCLSRAEEVPGAPRPARPSHHQPPPPRPFTARRPCAGCCFFEHSALPARHSCCTTVATSTAIIAMSCLPTKPCCSASKSNRARLRLGGGTRASLGLALGRHLLSVDTLPIRSRICGGCTLTCTNSITRTTGSTLIPNYIRSRHQESELSFAVLCL